MTDPNYTALLLVIDRSGSMQSIRDDMIGGIETMLREQVDAIPGGILTVDLVQFDDEIEHVHQLSDPQSVQVALEPRGRTALHDAIGSAVEWFGAELAGLPDHARPGNVQVLVVTDGFENASRRYTAAHVRDMVRNQQEAYSWDFTFLGANQDAVLTGGKLGFDAGGSLSYDAAPAAVSASYAAVSRRLAASRRGARTAFTQTDRDASAGGNP